MMRCPGEVDSAPSTTTNACRFLFSSHVAVEAAWYPHLFHFYMSNVRTHAHACRGERWALYHQATLVERAFRRTLVPADDGEAASVAVPPAVPSPADGGVDRPCVEHLAWSVPVLAHLLHCLHGLWAPETRERLGALQVAIEMDPGERAVITLNLTWCWFQICLGRL